MHVTGKQKVEINDFTVSAPTHSTFPMDMLRYDTAWPRNEEDAGRIEDTHRRLHPITGMWVIHLQCIGNPTPERWKSFGWTVG